MSAIDDIIITPWVGPTSYTNSLTVVVLSSSSHIIENISEALINVHTIGHFRWKLYVLRSFDLQNIARQSDLTGKLSIDFIIVAVDTSRILCLEWARNALESIDPDLRVRRVILVNATGSPNSAIAVNLNNLSMFCSDNGLEMLNADVSKLDDAQFLARRLLKYIEVSIGINTGIPNLNI